MKNPKAYLNLLTGPFETLRTKKVLQVNPTIETFRKDAENTKIFVYDFNKGSITENKLTRLEECYEYLDTPNVSWINIDGLRKKDVEQICSHFQVHPLIAEDILSIGQRPKMDEIDTVLYCLMNMLYFNEEQRSVEAEQISIILGPNFVLSFQEDASKDVFNPLRDKLKFPSTKIRQNGPDFLFYSLIDMIVDSYYIVMEKVGENIEMLEEDIIRRSDTRALARINMLRKEMILLKRSIGPVRELINGILRSESELIEEKTEKYFKDVYDHIIQANDLAESYRDMMINLQDLYLSNVNLKMNEVMKVMAIVTCLLAPATVIGGIFGMNFTRIPWLHNTYGFFIAVGLMLVIPIYMVFLFKRKGWF
ncbi:MAG: magnesium/cobalt transporter CorA [Bacteroidota bacterium]|nr:magnesium/cobalt transporter CorA [Bacteroidota bacterium]MDQ6890185.1 magnesium/cobalt transporter CorA [Bacteroidota bacterium]